MDAKAENSYASPASADDPPKENNNPHGASITEEAWRGAKFGGKVTAIIVGLIVVVGWVISIVTLSAQFGSGEVLFTPELIVFLLFTTLGQVVASLVAVALCSLFGAAVGAAVMAIAAFVRKILRSAADGTQ